LPKTYRFYLKGARKRLEEVYSLDEQVCYRRN
jgi:hypothetical protein